MTKSYYVAIALALVGVYFLATGGVPTLDNPGALVNRTVGMVALLLAAGVGTLRHSQQKLDRKLDQLLERVEGLHRDE